jgi:hypothetical protein
MKKVLFALLAVTVLVASSCSKEKKINKKLDGEWKATTFEGDVIASGESAVFTFTKDEKDNGSGVLTVTDPVISFTFPFTYTIKEDKMTMIYSILGSPDTSVVTINTYEKEKIEWTDSDGAKTVLEPK